MKNAKKRIAEICILAMFGALMFASKAAMAALPNIHLLGLLTMVCTVVFRAKALFPIYIYVLLEGLFYGFNAWWVPYLYIWTILWGVTMLLPKTMPKKAKCIVYPAVCALHGFLYGTLFSPVYALIMGMNPTQTLAWIAAGIPFDAVHGASNLFLGLFVLPLSELTEKLRRRI